MALRKEDFDYEGEPSPKKRSRITIDVSPEMRRRIKMAAAQNDLSVGEYVGRILEENLTMQASGDSVHRHAAPLIDPIVCLRFVSRDSTG